VNYVRRRCLQRVNLLKSVAGVSWGAHLSCLILLYERLIGSVLEYGSVCFTNMAKTHMLGLERIQYRALGLMGFTPFEGEVWSAGLLNMGRCIKGYSSVLSLDIVSFESFTRHVLPALLGTSLVIGHI
jgi:hypothetical protein